MIENRMLIDSEFHEIEYGVPKPTKYRTWDEDMADRKEEEYEDD